MRVLFLSHCAPDTPDKGEKIRAHYAVRRLGKRHELHLVCFAQQASEVESLRRLDGACASIHAELHHGKSALLRSALPFLGGGCLNLLYYHHRGIERRVAELAAEKPFDAAIAYTIAMAPYVPAGTPYLLDLQDVDSEKWFQYAERRTPAFLYRMEAERLRRVEIEYARRAGRTLFVTEAEERLFREIAGDGVRTSYIENGWEQGFYDDSAVAALPELAQRRYLAFTGSMGYYPNVEGALWFAREIFPELRRRDPGLEFFIVGRNPAKAIRGLASQPGITVTGAVADARPYLKGCLASVAPLKLARGIQMKVVEALSMGKTVLASPAIAKTFGGRPPEGAVVCRSADDYWRALAAVGSMSPAAIRAAALDRFDGYRNLEALERELEAIRPVAAR